MTQMIPLTQGKFAEVDDADFEWLNKWDWNYNQGYALRTVLSDTGRWGAVMMHREIMKTPKGMMTDHINGNGLDNRRANLRICTNRQNQWNQKTAINSVSRFKGVTWHSRDRIWQVHIRINGKITFLGTCASPEEGAKLYDEAAKKYFGEFARLNYNNDNRL